mgnify:CR=1 FL=1
MSRYRTSLRVRKLSQSHGPVSSILMSAASASTTAGAAIASATFAQTILAAGVSSVWAAAMTNCGATILDYLPHGSFFHSTGGSIGINLKERLKLIPYESLVRLTLVICSVILSFVFSEIHQHNTFNFIIESNYLTIRFYQVITLSTICCCSLDVLRKYILVVSMLSCPIRSAKSAMSLYFSRKFFANL